VTRELRVVERKKYGRAKARTQLPVLEALSFDNSRYAKGRPGYPRPPFRIRFRYSLIVESSSSS
jgi:hypothetical protein